MSARARLFAALCAFIAIVPTAQAQKRGGTLNFAVVAEPPNYDCHASQTFALIHPIYPLYSYLVRYDAAQGSKITGDLAKSWEVSPDALVYTFKLHDGVTFHDGSPLTSADVKASFDRIANPPAGGFELFETLRTFRSIELEYIRALLNYELALTDLSVVE